jgi:hypothetical protein
MKIELRFEDQYDREITKKFDSLGSLQDFVKTHLAHNLCNIPLSLEIDGQAMDVKKYVNDLGDLKPVFELPMSELVFDDKTRRFTDREQL